MPRGALIAVLVAAPTLAAAQTSDGWSFAHWGMSQTQVRAVFAGRAHPPTDDPDSPDDVVDGGATIDRFQFAVRLEYAAAGLVQIDLRLHGTAADCAALGDHLKATYGPNWSEADNDAFVTLTWAGARDGNAVAWTREGDGMDACEIELTPPG